MAKTKTTGRNAERKQNYAAKAAEGTDKESRNRAVNTLLSEGNPFVTGKYKAGEERVAATRLVAAKAESRSAKRAAAKASRSKQVSDFEHPHGPCGNVGCAACHPENRLPSARHRPLDFFFANELQKAKRAKRKTRKLLKRISNFQRA